MIRDFALALCLALGPMVAGYASDDLSKMFVEVGKKGLPAMVVVNSAPSQGFLEYYLGINPLKTHRSGFLISSNGYIVTTLTAIQDPARITVTLYDGRTVPARLINQKDALLLALVKIEEKDLPFLTFGNSDNLDIGEWVVALGVFGSKEPSLDAVVISNKGKRAVQGTSFKENENLIEIDRIVHGAQSNEPILNLKNEVIGTTTQYNAWSKQKTPPPISLSYLYSSNYIKPLIDNLIRAAQMNDPTLEAPTY